MSLSKAEALNLREGDVILVPMMVLYTNNFFDDPRGAKITVESPQNRYTREEREKPRQKIDLQSIIVHSVLKRRIDVKDRVEWLDQGEWRRGVVIFIDGNEITVKRDGDEQPRNRVFLLSDLHRVGRED